LNEQSQNQSTTEASGIDERRNCTSASNAEADARCPGRHLKQKGLPRRPSSDSNTGNRIHEALAKRDPSGLKADEADIYSRCIEIEIKKVKEFFGSEVPSKDLRSWAEERFWIMFQAPEMRLEHSGKVDRVYRYGNRALVMDYKTLPGDVAESPRNMQLRDLAVLVRGHFLVEEVGAVIIQPLVESDPPICLYSTEALNHARDELFPRVLASNNPQSPRVPGEVPCKFCLGTTTCVEYQRWAGAMVPNMLEVLEVPVAEWTPDQRKIFCDRYDVAYRWLTRVWSEMEEGSARQPGFVPGYALLPGNERSEIVNPQLVFERFVGKGGQPADFMQAVKVTKTPLKEKYKALTGLAGKKLDTAMKELLEGATETKQNKPSLRPV